jgi:hypothetical protein
MQNLRAGWAVHNEIGEDIRHLIAGAHAVGPVLHTNLVREAPGVRMGAPRPKGVRIFHCRISRETEHSVVQWALHVSFRVRYLRESLWICPLRVVCMRVAEAITTGGSLTSKEVSRATLVTVIPKRQQLAVVIVCV